MPRDPLASHYEIAIAVVYPTLSFFFNHANQNWLSALFLMFGLAHEIMTLNKMETLQWGEQNGKWTNLFRHLYYHTSRGFTRHYEKFAVLLLSVVITLNFYIMYIVGLYQMNFALYCYGFLGSATVWFWKYRSGFPSADQFVEYRKQPIRPVTIAIYVGILVQLWSRLSVEQTILYLFTAFCTCLLEVLRQRVHYDHEFAAILRKLEATRIKLDGDHNDLQFHNALMRNAGGYVVFARGEQEIYDVDEKDIVRRSLIVLALIVSTCGIKVRLRNIDWNKNGAKLIPFYVRHLRLIAGAYNYDPTFDAEDIVFMFSENVSQEFLRESFKDIEFLQEALSNIESFDELTVEQKQRGKTHMTQFFSLHIKRKSALPKEIQSNDS